MNMFELTTGTDVRALESFADATALHRRCRRRFSFRRNSCLVTGNGSLNNVGILNILNGFGGGWGWGGW
jgi:hypothetical protein